ncbi:conserved protein, unknown function, partial [Hepatocystis sp. ex Piliocolobus tephrosceles]
MKSTLQKLKMPPPKLKSLPPKTKSQINKPSAEPEKSNGLSTKPNALPTKPNALPPKFNVLPTKPNALPTKPNALPPKLNTLPPKLNTLPPKLNVLPPKPNVLPAKQNETETKLPQPVTMQKMNLPKTNIKTMPPKSKPITATQEKIPNGKVPESKVNLKNTLIEDISNFNKKASLNLVKNGVDNVMKTVPTGKNTFLEKIISPILKNEYVIPKSSNTTVKKSAPTFLEIGTMLNSLTSTSSKELNDFSMKKKMLLTENAKSINNENITNDSSNVIKKHSNIDLPCLNLNDNKTESTTNNNFMKDNNNVMIAIGGRENNIGPLSTYKDSNLIQNMHYINAFSRTNGNYIGKVTGPPPTSLTSLDKIPQNNNEKRYFNNNINNMFQNPNYNALESPFNNYPYIPNLPFYNDSYIMENTNEQNTTLPFPCYPGLYYVPVYVCDPTMNNYATGGLYETGYGVECQTGVTGVELPKQKKNGKKKQNGKKKGKENCDETDEHSDEHSDKHSCEYGKKDKHNKKKKKKNSNEKNVMIAAGSLKPLQFRNGAEWNSEDEEYLNSEISLKQTVGNKKKQKKKKKKYMGNTKWYDIE